MNICLLHGYLLEGSGSNIYVQNLARTYCQKGHTVYLLCQEKKLKKYDFVTSYSVLTRDNRNIKTIFKRKTPYAAPCHVINPHIGGLLPVYVKDRYEFFKRVKTFPELTAAELRGYIQKNVTALKTLLQTARIDMVHAQHVIMSPYIATEALKKTGIPFIISAHGSAFNYSTKDHPHLQPYARTALKEARFLCSPSRYLNHLLIRYFPVLREKTKVIPCGVDVEQFKPITHIKKHHIRQLTDVIQEKLKVQKSGKTAAVKKLFDRQLASCKNLSECQKWISLQRKTYDPHHLDRDLVQTLRQIRWGKDRIVTFVGKFMPTKGAQVILACAPLLLKQFKDLKFIFVGYGKYRESLEAMIHALSHGNPKLFSAVAGREKKYFKPFLNSGYFKTARQTLPHRVFFTGLLEHAELRRLLPLSDILMVPSLFPETFGMIAAEGMASGVVPLTTYQTGLKDMHDITSSILKDQVKLKKMAVNAALAQNIQKNIEMLLTKNIPRKSSTKKALHQYAQTHFSWEKIADVCLKDFI